MDETYIDRIKKIKNEKKIKNDELAAMTGIPLGTLSKILAGISDSPKLSNIVAICGALECSVDYILTGIPENRNNYTLEEGEMTMVEGYRNLDRFGREMVMLVINKEAERVNESRRSGADTIIIGGRPTRAPNYVAGSYVGSAIKNASGIIRRDIDLYDLPVSAGTGVYLTETESVSISIPDNNQTRAADFALRIKGDSMEPKYHDGDILLVEECDFVEYGELGIFMLDGEGFFKKFEGDRLISLNPAYNPIMLKNYGEIICCGKVIGKLRRK